MLQPLQPSSPCSPSDKKSAPGPQPISDFLFAGCPNEKFPGSNLIHARFLSNELAVNKQFMVLTGSMRSRQSKTTESCPCMPCLPSPN